MHSCAPTALGVRGGVSSGRWVATCLQVLHREWPRLRQAILTRS